MSSEDDDTRDRLYTEHLIRIQRTPWRRLLNVQAPYRWKLWWLRPGFTLDVGCGIGRNLANLGGHAVGIDHNPHSVEEARRAGFRAFTPEQFRLSELARPRTFDALLLSHVAEHMRRDELVPLLREHLEYVRSGGLVIVETPQEVGFRSDRTHVEFMDFASLRGVADELGLQRVRDFSFPLPRLFGRVFVRNEFVSVSRKP